MDRFNDVMWVIFAFLLMIFLMTAIALMCVTGYNMLASEGETYNFSVDCGTKDLDVQE